jgi:hypothetical protein
MRRHVLLTLLIGTIASLSAGVLTAAGQPAPEAPAVQAVQAAAQAAPPAQSTPPPQATKEAPKPAAATTAQPAPPPRFPRANVRVEVTITDQNAAAAPVKKSIGLTVRDEGSGSVRSGVSMPIPNTTFTPATEGQRPITSFSYKDVGLSLDVTRVSIQDNFVSLRLSVEYNPVDEKAGPTEGAATSAQTPASFARFSQTLDLVLESGKPLVVAQSSDPVQTRNRTASLEVKATILK